MIIGYVAKVAAAAAGSAAAFVFGSVSMVVASVGDAMQAGAFTVAGVGGLAALMWRLVRDNRVETEQKDRYEKMLNDKDEEIALLHQRYNREYALVAAYRNHFGEIPPDVYRNHVAPFDLQPPLYPHGSPAS